MLKLTIDFSLIQDKEFTANTREVDRKVIINLNSDCHWIKDSVESMSDGHKSLLYHSLLMNIQRSIGAIMLEDALTFLWMGLSPDELGKELCIMLGVALKLGNRIMRKLPVHIDYAKHSGGNLQ